ncbi:uncharacterized protein [Rutidosis leptorrhynchoides]|uniref:uncharacterized protein n=1 Tax=Rutidosis leptorrhynchoides TaxID=125765 RepID=UPI003A99925D
MESTLLSSARYISTKSNSNVRQFQSSFSGKLFVNTHFTKSSDAYTNYKSSTVKITSLFSLGKKKAKVTKRETVIPDPDYRIPVVLLGVSGLLVYQDNLIAAAPVGLLGLLLLFQTTRVRFVFDDEALEVKVGQELDDSGENVFVGGKNRWKYSSFINWELWWPSFPILVYFKEAQTKPEGQVHFFPVIFNGKQLYDVMVERAGPSKTSTPK